MSIGPRVAPWRRAPWLLVAALVAIVGCWIIGSPRSAGPDEPSHMITAAGIVRGDRDGEPSPDPNGAGTRIYELPGMVGAPDPGCWAAQPAVPAACASAAPLATAESTRISTSANYPPWALILPGLASFVEWAGGYAYLARWLSAAGPVALLAFSLLALARGRAELAATALVGLTPIVWFSLGTVNPSATAIAGGLALWTGLLDSDTRRADALAVAGWAAVAVARRDGPLWATLIVAITCGLLTQRPSDIMRRLSTPARAIVIVAVALALYTPLRNGDRGLNLVMAVAPLGLIAVDLVLRTWAARPAPSARRRVVAAAAGTVALGIVVAALVRPGGYDAQTNRLVVSNTGDHLRQVVGILGWLDTPVPTIAVYAFWAAIGGLAAIAIGTERRAALAGAAVIGAAVVAAWVLELGQGSSYGDYWQGRYSMPLMVGLPVVLAWRAQASEPSIEPSIDPAPDGAGRSIAVVTAWCAWAIWNVAFLAAQQRWGVGVDGVWDPTAWDTWGPPLPPVVVSVAHSLATAALAWWATAPNAGAAS